MFRTPVKCKLKRGSLNDFSKHHSHRFKRHFSVVEIVPAHVLPTAVTVSSIFAVYVGLTAVVPPVSGTHVICTVATPCIVVPFKRGESPAVVFI